MDCSQLHMQGNPHCQIATEQPGNLQRKGSSINGTNCNGEGQQLVREGSGINGNIESLLFCGGAVTQPIQLQGLQNEDIGAMSSSSSNQDFLLSCRFCCQNAYPTSELLLEHERACPMQLQAVQQLLQLQQQCNPAAQRQQLVKAQQAAAENELQQMQQQRFQYELQQHQLQMHTNQFQHDFTQHQNLEFNLHNELQRQLQMQQDLMKRQFDLHQNQPILSHSISMIGTDACGQFMPTATLSLFDKYLRGQQSQNQGLNYLPEHQTGGCNADFAGQSFHQGQVQPEVAKHQYQYQELQLPRSSSADSSMNHFPLALPEDAEWLTPLHCFVRQYCVEVFVATPEDIAAPCTGKRNHVTVNQVGIRCQYCSPSRVASISRVDIAKAAGENGMVYPSLISRIYNSSINLLQRHLRSCPHMPPEILARYDELKCSNSRSGASKKYWALSAEKLGLIDSPDGIRLDKDAHAAHVAAQEGNVTVDARQEIDATVDESSTLLVSPSEKHDTTTFTFHVMSQLRPCVFTEADRLGRRRGLKVGFPGLACRHCHGEHVRSGRFFPGTIKTMADASKTLDVVYRHVMKCKECPWNIKAGLKTLREFHDTERSKMPFRNQRGFFVKIWGRLHQDDDTSLPGEDLVASASSAASASSPLSLLPSTTAPVPVKMDSPTVDSLQGLYATVRRQSESFNEHKAITEHLNKLVTEAA